MILASVTVFFLVLLDQITKLAASEHLKGKPAVSLIPGIFELQYLENRGAAFGTLQNQRWFFHPGCFYRSGCTYMVFLAPSG